MIARLRGRILERDPGSVVLDVNGVGYLLSTPDSTWEQMPPAGEEAFLYVHTHVREDAIQLYGFASRSELRLFETAVGVGGIGPRLALVILSHLSPDAFARAVVHGDTGALTKVPGIGKKTAARILLELKDKLQAPDAGKESTEPPDRERIDDPEPRTSADAVAALVALGYREEEARHAVSRAQELMRDEVEDAPQLITAALKSLDRAV